MNNQDRADSSDDEIASHCTYEAFELCLLNAERLLDDSESASRPTKAALMELALEECGKAFLVLLWAVINELNSRIDKIRGDSESRVRVVVHDAQDFGLNDLHMPENVVVGLRRLQEIFDKKTLNEAFCHHNVKLESIAFILDRSKSFVQNITVEQITGLMKNQALMNYVGSFLHITDLYEIREMLAKNNEALKEAIEEIRRIFGNTDVAKVRNLDKLKKTGFYVNYKSSKHTFVFPTGLPDFESEGLKKIIIGVIQILRVIADFVPQIFSIEPAQGEQKQ
ncbi:MAG: hypothetical protein JRN68_09650 [Nitrososphaerota archaeon]|nr:hypothetical protein [Nitrososphaerota archaeon]